jgi:hypothetical protein
MSAEVLAADDAHAALMIRAHELEVATTALAERMGYIAVAMMREFAKVHRDNMSLAGTVWPTTESLRAAMTEDGLDAAVVDAAVDMFWRSAWQEWTAIVNEPGWGGE